MRVTRKRMLTATATILLIGNLLAIACGVIDAMTAHNALAMAETLLATFVACVVVSSMAALPLIIIIAITCEEFGIPDN